jgi:3'(2'), 5'-bisphosphate nucleotidase
VEDDDLAVGVAKTAGAILLAVRAAGLLEGKAAGSAGDAIAHVWIERALREARPDDGFLSEEGADDHARLQQRRVWVVDPLDGTREFSEGRHDWAVHIALVIDGVPSAAAVALPALDVVLSTASPLKLASPPDGPLRIVVSRTRAPELAELVAQRLGAELVPQGSAGFKTMAIVRGEAHAYVHAGGQYEWRRALAHTCLGWMGPSSGTTRLTRCCLIWWCVVPRSRQSCWRRSLT